MQAGFLLAWLDPLDAAAARLCGPVFHCYSCPLATFACPIGVLANFSALHMIPFAAMGTLVVLGAAVRQVHLRLGLPIRISARPDRDECRRRSSCCRPGRACFATWCWWTFVLAIPYLWGEGHPAVLLPALPGGGDRGGAALHARLALPASLIWPSVAKLIILIVVVAAMFFAWRPWCTLFCPLGAIYGLVEPRFVRVPSFSSESLHRLRRLPQPVPRHGQSRAPDRRAAMRSLHGMHSLPGGDGRNGADGRGGASGQAARG